MSQSIYASKKDNKSAKDTAVRPSLRKDGGFRSAAAPPDVRIHYNSEKPSELDARAYTYGSDIYLGPGQEKHLPHELNHIIQQRQGLVSPTRYLNALPLNDDPLLESAADKPPLRAPLTEAGIAVVQRSHITIGDMEAFLLGYGCSSTLVAEFINHVRAKRGGDDALPYGRDQYAQDRASFPPERKPQSASSTEAPEIPLPETIPYKTPPIPKPVGTKSPPSAAADSGKGNREKATAFRSWEVRAKAKLPERLLLPFMVYLTDRYSIAPELNDGVLHDELKVFMRQQLIIQPKISVEVTSEKEKPSGLPPDVPPAPQPEKSAETKKKEGNPERKEKPLSVYERLSGPRMTVTPSKAGSRTKLPAKKPVPSMKPPAKSSKHPLEMMGGKFLSEGEADKLFADIKNNPKVEFSKYEVSSMLLSVSDTVRSDHFAELVDIAQARNLPWPSPQRPMTETVTRIGFEIEPVGKDLKFNFTAKNYDQLNALTNVTFAKTDVLEVLLDNVHQEIRTKAGVCELEFRTLPLELTTVNHDLKTKITKQIGEFSRAFSAGKMAEGLNKLKQLGGSWKLVRDLENVFRSTGLIIIAPSALGAPFNNLAQHVTHSLPLSAFSRLSQKEQQFLFPDYHGDSLKDFLIFTFEHSIKCLVEDGDGNLVISAGSRSKSSPNIKTPLEIIIGLLRKSPEGEAIPAASSDDYNTVLKALTERYEQWKTKIPGKAKTIKIGTDTGTLSTSDIQHLDFLPGTKHISLEHSVLDKDTRFASLSSEEKLKPPLYDPKLNDIRVLVEHRSQRPLTDAVNEALKGKGDKLNDYVRVFRSLDASEKDGAFAHLFGGGQTPSHAPAMRGVPASDKQALISEAQMKLNKFLDALTKARQSPLESSSTEAKATFETKATSEAASSKPALTESGTEILKRERQMRFQGSLYHAIENDKAAEPPAPTVGGQLPPPSFDGTEYGVPDAIIPGFLAGLSDDTSDVVACIEREFESYDPPGDGDCLFHALEGRDLSTEEILDVRLAVSNVRRSMTEGDALQIQPGHGTLIIRQSLIQSGMAAGFDTRSLRSAPRGLIADMQAIPGVYGGREEIAQWARLRHRTVVSIEGQDITRFTAAGAPQLVAGEYFQGIESALGDDTVVLYLSGVHWKRVLRRIP